LLKLGLLLEGDAGISKELLGHAVGTDPNKIVIMWVKLDIIGKRGVILFGA
jgi:hypothetical protein